MPTTIRTFSQFFPEFADDQPLPSLGQVFNAAEEEDEREEKSLADRVLEGALLNSQPGTNPLDQTFDDFFRQHAPARRLLFDTLSGAIANEFGQKRVSLRDRLFKEFQQRQVLAQRGAENSARLALGIEQLEEQRRANEIRQQQASKKFELDVLKERFDQQTQLQDLQIKTLQLENTLANGRMSRQKADLETQKLQKDLEKLVEGTPFQSIMNQELKEGSTFQEALDSYVKFVRAQAVAQDQPNRIEKLINDRTIQETVSSVEGGISKLDSLAPELEIPTRAAMFNRRSVIQNPQFRKEMADVLTGLNLFSELTTLVRQAKTEAGIDPNSPGLLQRLRGMFATAASVLGTDELAKVLAVGRISLAEATRMARSFGEQRVTDVDLQRFLGNLPNVKDPERVINTLYAANRKNMFISIRNSIDTLPQINPPKIVERRDITRVEADANKQGVTILEHLINAKRFGIRYE